MIKATAIYLISYTLIHSVWSIFWNFRVREWIYECGGVYTEYVCVCDFSSGCFLSISHLVFSSGLIWRTAVCILYNKWSGLHTRTSLHRFFFFSCIAISFQSSSDVFFLFEFPYVSVSAYVAYISSQLLRWKLKFLVKGFVSSENIAI